MSWTQRGEQNAHESSDIPVEILPADGAHVDHHRRVGARPRDPADGAARLQRLAGEKIRAQPHQAARRTLEFVLLPIAFEFEQRNVLIDEAAVLYREADERAALVRRLEADFRRLLVAHHCGHVTSVCLKNAENSCKRGKRTHFYPLCGSSHVNEQDRKKVKGIQRPAAIIPSLNERMFTPSKQRDGARAVSDRRMFRSGQGATSERLVQVDRPLSQCGSKVSCKTIDWKRTTESNKLVLELESCTDFFRANKSHLVARFVCSQVNAFLHPFERNS